MTAIKSISARAVVDTIGVNTHIDFNTSGYQNLATTIAALKYLRVRHIRDCPGQPASVTGPRAWSVVAAATGCKFLAFIGETSPASALTQLGWFSTLAGQGVLDGIDGPNEWDTAYPLGQGTSLPLAAAFQQKVWALGQSLHLPVVNISFGAGWVPPLYHGNYDKVGDLSALCDFGNAHTYPSTTQSPESMIQFMNGLAKLAAASRPPMHTEYGYNSSQGFAQSDMARNDLFAILDGVFYGSARLYFYALFDDIAGLFGVMNQDGTPKLSGTAIHNFITIVDDIASGQGDSLDFTLSGTTANDKSLLMEKSDGSFLLALWNESDPAHTISLSLAKAATTVSIFDPIAGTSAVQTLSNVSGVSISLPTHPLLVQIVGTGIPPVISTQVPTAITLNPVALPLLDNAQPGITATLVTVTTDDGKPFGGTLTVDAPFKMSGSIVVLGSALPPGAASLAPVVTATENGTSVKATLAVTVTAAPPAPLQTPLSVKMTPGTVTIDDASPVGTHLTTAAVTTSDGLAFKGTLVGDTMVDVTQAGSVTLKGLLPPGPATISASVSATGNGMTATQALAINLTHGVTPPPPPPPAVITPDPQWGPPLSLQAKTSATIKVAGVAVSDQYATGHAGTMALNIDVAQGVVTLFDRSGAPQSGSGTNRLRLALSLEDVNATLMGLQYTAPATAGADSISLTVFDQSGKKKSVVIPITVS